MTPEHQRIAIAEACGWTTKHKGLWVERLQTYAALPNYLNDLNAMHELEGILTNEQIEVYCSFLQKPQWGIWWGIHATASQRAEAFLRTIGKWEEAK